MKRACIAFFAAASVVLLTFPSAPARAQSTDSKAKTQEELEQEIEELQRRLEILTTEVRKVKEAQTVPEKVDLKSQYGMGPAASKVYSKERGLSLGGYGEFNFKKEVADGDGNDVFDFVRFVGYVGYKFTDKLLFNTEIELEHASTDKAGSVSLEFGYLDYAMHPKVSLRGGLLLIPVGFINELHEPVTYHGNQRPEVERLIIPTTWRANGAGIYGELMPGLTYRTYAVTSMRAEGFRSGNIRGGRQKGSEALANDWSFVGRLDYNPTPGLTFGASAYMGDQGQDQELYDRAAADPNDPDDPGTPIGTADAFMQMYEGHAQWHWRGLEFRALGVVSLLEDSRQLSLNASQPIAKRMVGWYTELAYNVLPLMLPGTGQYLAPWARYSVYDTQDKVPNGFDPRLNDNRSSIEVGIDYKPIPQVVLKVDYRNETAERGSRPDLVRIGGGFVF